MKKVCSLIVTVCTVLLLVSSVNTAAAATQDVIESLLVNGRQTYAETKEDLRENGGESFILGDGTGDKTISDEGLVLIAPENENPMFNLVRRLQDVDGVIDGNQAIHIKFKPSAKDFGVMLFAAGNTGITIGEESEALMFIGMGQYMEALPGDIRIQPGQWYHVLLAMRNDSTLLVALWKDGEEENLAFDVWAIGPEYGEDAFENQSWEATIGFRGDAILTVDSYAYYTFENLIMDGKVTSPGDAQAAIDAGPWWAINIGGNFDIVSDMVWQSVEPQEITAGGDMVFMGYNLKDLMDFSGNGSAKATVVFGQEDAQSQIAEPTYDAYIVYQQNGEFMGGPYLLSMDGLSEYPVIQVLTENEADQSSEDYGPQWVINIADNFDVMSDWVWRDISPQTVTTANGDEYLGCGLKELLDFSGNGSAVATVWFNNDGENNMLVEPTFDAYIVYMKNGEFMGGPYLITINGVSEDPVTDIYP